MGIIRQTKSLIGLIIQIFYRVCPNRGHLCLDIPVSDLRRTVRYQGSLDNGCLTSRSSSQNGNWRTPPSLPARLRMAACHFPSADPGVGLARVLRRPRRRSETPLRARQLYWGWSNFAPPPTAGSWRDRLSRHCSRDLEGRGAVSGSLAGMFPARRLPPRLQIVGKSWQFSKLPADPGMESMGGARRAKAPTCCAPI